MPKFKSKKVYDVEAASPTLADAVATMIKDIEAGDAVEQDLDDLLEDNFFKGPELKEEEKPKVAEPTKVEVKEPPKVEPAEPQKVTGTFSVTPEVKEK